MNSTSSENKKPRIIKTSSKTPKKKIKADAKNRIPKKAKNTFKMKRRNRRAGGIIYIGHIPHGFYEDEMKSYFNQFGKVLATVVARSKKTGRSKGFGFVEFKDEEVAKIAAETMNNYLMFNKVLKCRYIPPEEKRGPIIERKITAVDFQRQENRKIMAKQKEASFSNLTQSMYLKKTEEKIAKFKQFFQERGIDFTFQIKSPKGSEEKTKTTSTTGSETESKDDTGDEFGVLEIDESENEISFKTPPQVKKVIKKSLTSSVKEHVNSNNSQAGKDKTNLLKKSRLKKSQNKMKVVKNKVKQKGKVGVSQKINKKKEKQEEAEKPGKSKLRSSRRKIMISVKP